MSQTNNGKSISEKLNSLIERLEAFDKQMGLSVKLSPETQSEAQKLIELSPGELRKLTKEEAQDGAFILQQMAFFLQKIINHENAIIKWAEECLGRILSQAVGILKNYYTAEERKMAAIRESDQGKELHAIIVERKIRIEKMAFLINRIENLAKALISRRV